MNNFIGMISIDDMFGQYIILTVIVLIVVFSIISIIISKYSYRYSNFIITLLWSTPLIAITFIILNTIFGFIDSHEDMETHIGWKIIIGLSLLFSLVKAINSKPISEEESKRLDIMREIDRKLSQKRKIQSIKDETKRQSRYSHVCSNCEHFYGDYCDFYSEDGDRIITPNISSCHFFSLKDTLQ